MLKNSDIHRVVLALMPGAPIFELAVPCEVFGIERAEIADPWYRLDVCATEPGAVVSGGFAAIDALGLDALAEADTVIVPACANVHAAAPHDLVEAVAAAHHRGARIASICSGAFVLAAAGILDGRKATTHWMHAELLARRYPAVQVDPTVIYTQDGRVFTSAGTAAGIDLCLELVRQDHGTAAANALARRLVTPPHRSADQAQFILSPVVEGSDSPLASTLQWARRHLGEPIRVRDLARHAHLSERQLSRRFLDLLGCTPGEWLLKERLRRAQELLEVTDHSIERIASLSGFGTSAGLRGAFVQHLHVSPSQYRKTWAA
ncbi:AraC family transcriptional regulator with amidase-like domain [Brevibacterium sanguinis]|uniref:AraC family transcriptional regulator with amidase-like domain n=2 Tax=Brevibacterium TaxID=1696 RepID=A0A366IGX2_9MICO|nr:MULTISPECIES: helix-turn-helix domain-containing protein [Brevibacterium]RBP63943.1 AraC family transcriptional regulator with amidase-like domain [Brevibacterium sanguinis]RBP70782.1 AraC family transcriptional regulator with amidase-like domain [Brevibacterium celere]